MASAGKRSKTAENNAAQYKINKRAEVNRLKRLNKQLTLQPNNAQVKRALKTTKMHRKTPVNPIWSASWIATAKLFKLFQGSFDPDIMSSNPEIARTALQKQSKTAAFLEAHPLKFNIPKSFFSIATRLGQ